MFVSNMYIHFFCIIFTVISAVPIKEIKDEDVVKEFKAGKIDGNVTENEVDLEPRAGIIDNLNPFGQKPPQQPQTNQNKDNGQNNNNPLGAVQNLFANAPQLLNGSNPFAQLFSSQPGGNFLDNVKIFLVGTQGMVMPASAMLGGFQTFMQTLGNIGNILPAPSGK